MIPGRALHRLAARICSAKMLERVVEPAIADLQKEYADAAHQLRSRRVLILLTGYLAVVEVIAMTALEKPRVANDERRALVRTFAWAAGATVCAFGLLLFLTVAALPGIPPFYVALMTPMMLPIAIPIGLTLGIAFGLDGRTISLRTTKIVLVSAVLAAVVSYSTMTWGVAIASRSFRQSMSNALGAHGSVTKGLHEISFAAGQRERSLAPGGDLMGMPRRLAWTYHLQVAMAFATPLLALLALAAIHHGARRSIVMAACACYFLLVIGGEALVYRGLPPIAGAWLPNVIFATATAYLMSSRPPTMQSSLSPAR